MKRALITGVSGQDGSYLSELLLGKGYAVYGTTRPGGIQHSTNPAVHVLEVDLEDPHSILLAAAEAKADEVFNLAGVSDLKTAFADPDATTRINYESVGILLQACTEVNPKVRFLQASSSEIFLPSPLPLVEDSPRDLGTQNPYALAKLRADRDFIQGFRTARDTFACSAFLFNHDSPRRSTKSALRKITQTLAQIKVGAATELQLGNVELFRDWGFAADYAVAMWKMLQLESPEDFVIATGTLHQVKDAVDMAAEAIGIPLTWQGSGIEAFACTRNHKKIVTINPDLFRPAEPFPKLGNAEKARRLLKWHSTISFKQMLEDMAREDLRLTQCAMQVGCK